MKHLFEACKPRNSVFEGNNQDDVLNLSNLIQGTINPDDFFNENYLTAGMTTLFTAAFDRFIGKGANGVVKLVQAMGGGKTHNMISLALLAKYPEQRHMVLNNSEYTNLGTVRVAAFSGRESDAPLGIWGSIAEQIGRKEKLKDYYSPLKAPGETAWIELLKGEPLLILLDEIPPYLENAKSITVGNSDLSVVTATALSNLFSALGKSELSNICVVISDLKATYESGSELIQSSFKNLENEVNRGALDIVPVGTNSNEIYQILKKRLFVELPSESDINEIAIAYKDEINKARQMNYTTMNADKVYTGIKDSYPFHPSMRDLYARFKENPGFQQTRGLIRLMRQIVAGLYANDGERACKKYLINVYDFNLNNRTMNTIVTQIKPSLSNAISHDIASNGMAVAEEIDVQYQEELVTDISKLILVASLADVPNALLGLPLTELVGDLCEPGRDIAGLKKAFDDFQMKAWYMDNDKDGRIFFKNQKNLIAELQSMVESYDNESVKTTKLKEFLLSKFSPSIKDCYQDVLVFPAVDDINIVSEKVTLILSEPNVGNSLNPVLVQYYNNLNYKNRILFLTGQRDTMERLYNAAKELKAIEKIISNMKDERVPEENQQYQLAVDMKVKKITAVLSAAQQTFTTLYYPNKNGLQSSSFTMEFKENNYNGEDQIRKLLIEKQKLMDVTNFDVMRRKCEDRLFTRKEMRWTEILERAATETVWQWHFSKTFTDMLNDSISKDIWRKNGDYIEKGPFEKEPTSVTISDRNSGDIAETTVLKILPIHGDKVFYEIGAEATPGSAIVSDVNNFMTNEVKISFLCIDSTGEYPMGEPVEWIREIKIKHSIEGTTKGQQLTLKTINGVKIKYTTDGSNPKDNGGVYEAPILLAENVNFVLVVAEFEGCFYDEHNIKIEKVISKELIIDATKPLLLRKKIRTSETKKTFEEIKCLENFVTGVNGVSMVLTNTTAQGNDNGYIELVVGTRNSVNPTELSKVIDNLKSSFIENGTTNVEMDIDKMEFATGQKFKDWINNSKRIISEFNQGDIEQ